MKYLMIETDEHNRIPYGINKNRAVDVRFLTKEGLKKIPLRNVLEMNFQDEGFFPDLICSPFLMVSETLFEVIRLYQQGTKFRIMKLWDRDKHINATYFWALIDEIDVMSDNTRFNITGNRIEKLVLSREKIGARAVFRVKDFDKSCLVCNIEFVESALRRDVRGIKITEVEAD